MNKDRVLKQNQFIKMHGAGNCFILIQHYSQTDEQLRKLAQKLCHPKLGIGADGLLVISVSKDKENSNYYMKVFNSDGSYPQMCGNGLRCFCACLRQLGMEKQDEFEIKTDAGWKRIKVSKNDKNYNVKAVLGQLQQDQQSKNMSNKISSILPHFAHSVSSLLTFNVEHLVIYLQNMPTQQQIVQYGRSLQEHINANINFAKVVGTQDNKAQVQLRTFERGCGLTLACGTGACATYVVGLRNKLLDGPTRIITEGGILKISIEDMRVVMDGPAQFICRGSYF